MKENKPKWEERFDKEFGRGGGNGIEICMLITAYDKRTEKIKDLISSTLQDAITEERERNEDWKLVAKEIYESLEDMYAQYCPGEYGHQFMSAGEHAELILEKYSKLSLIPKTE